MSTYDIDPIFQEPSVGKSAGITKWRIENKCVVLQDDNNGKFFDGDAYIVLSTKVTGANKFSYDIHFWLGAECSVDESGIAAYKSVELDQALGGIATQYRECQGNESDLFASLFKGAGGIEYIPGGVDSGFKHVERDVYDTRLLHLKGKRTVHVSQVPTSASSLVQDDAFILDMGLNLYVWCGTNANKYEKVKALEVVTNINNDERGARATITHLEDDPRCSAFWDALGGYTTDIPVGESDDSVPDYPPNKLLKICDESGTVEVTDIPLENGKLKRDLLNSDDAFIVVSKGQVYIWVGKGCTLQEKKEASANAVNYLSTSGMDKNTKITRISENHESGAFKALFAKWSEPVSFKRMKNIAENVEEKDIDVNELLSACRAEDVPVDDGSGKVECYVVKDFNLVEIPDVNHGEFFGGDSYVVCYTYMENGREKALIYFWLGQDSTADERGSAALLTKNMDDTKFRGGATQVRVTQGKEPAHFRAIFKGTMIVHTGGNASGFANSKEVDTKDVDGIALFHVKSTAAANAVGVQVTETASSLVGEDCFVLLTPNTTYVWFGNASDDDEKATAMTIGSRLNNTYLNQDGRTLVEITEGNEPDDFWASLGGKGPYMEFAPGEEPPRAARLFEASTATGAFKCEEVVSFNQEDLCDDDIYLLDTYKQLFVWIGNGSTEEEKKKSAELSAKFISDATDGRDPDMAVINIMAGNEPSMFTQHFLGWDVNYATKHSFVDPYAAKMEQMKKAAAEKQAELDAADAAECAQAASEAPAVVAPSKSTYTVEELRGRIPGVEPHKKEDYLTDADFSTVFNMSRSEFSALPAWKAKAAKQKAGLF